MISIFYTKNDKMRSHDYLLFLLKKELCKEYTESDLKKTEKGKLYIENCPVKFNITHSKDIIIVAFSDKSEIGVDIEKKKDLDYKKLSGKYFNSEPKDLDDFYRLWTTAEAFVKYKAKSIFVELKDIVIDDMGIIYKNEKQSCFYKTEKFEDYIYTVVTDSNDNIKIQLSTDFE